MADQDYLQDVLPASEGKTTFKQDILSASMNKCKFMIDSFYFPPAPAPPMDLTDPSGFKYKEYYLYSHKNWEIIPSGVSLFILASGVLQNAPIIVTKEGYETTTPSQPWGQTSGVGKYNKVGYGFFDLLGNGQYNPGAEEFSLHPSSNKKLVFNGILKDNVFVEYEAGPSGYYIMDSVDYNPIRAEVEGGFVHFSEVTEPNSLFLSASQNSIRADGYRRCKLTATLYDEDFDRIPNKDIIFELRTLLPAIGTTGYWSELGSIIPYEGSVRVIDASGQAIESVEVTNRRGEAYVDYLTNDYKTGIIEVKAYYLNASGIYDTVGFAQYYLSSSPFVLDVSLLDALDYLT